MPYVLKSVKVTINSVDLSSYVVATSLTREFEQVDNTTMSSGGARSYGAGLENNTLEVTFLSDFSATAVYDTLKSLVGTTTTVKVKPTSASTAATNPEFTLTGATLLSLPLVDGTVGDNAQMVATFVGGAYTVATA
jgi:hypothetical protein